MPKYQKLTSDFLMFWSRLSKSRTFLVKWRPHESSSHMNEWNAPSLANQVGGHIWSITDPQPRHRCCYEGLVVSCRLCVCQRLALHNPLPRHYLVPFVSRNGALCCWPVVAQATLKRNGELFRSTFFSLTTCCPGNFCLLRLLAFDSRGRLFHFARHGGIPVSSTVDIRRAELWKYQSAAYFSVSCTDRSRWRTQAVKYFSIPTHYPRMEQHLSVRQAGQKTAVWWALCLALEEATGARLR